MFYLVFAYIGPINYLNARSSQARRGIVGIFEVTKFVETGRGSGLVLVRQANEGRPAFFLCRADVFSSVQI
jgi:hypothetical protein